MAELLTTKKLAGAHVVAGPKRKRVGKVGAFVFHPRRARCVGILVKRPDAALMFKRKDAFVALDALALEDGQVVVAQPLKDAERSSLAALDASLDDCVLWVGMPAMTEDQQLVGYVDNVAFDAESGNVAQITAHAGLANDALLGKHVVKAELIRGFKRGFGMALAQAGSYDGGQVDPQVERGAIIVADEALAFSTLEGGVAAAAGKATARTANAVKKGARQVRTQVDAATEAARPTVQRAARAADEAVSKGAFAVGRQIGRGSGLWSSMKEGFLEGLNSEGDEDEDEDG